MDLSIFATLVRDRPRLIIPSLGAFLVANLDTGFRVENVSFSPYLKYNDGSLLSAIGASAGLDQAAAIEVVKALRQQILDALERDGKCVFPGLGVLNHPSPDSWEFQPDASAISTNTQSVPIPVVAPASPQPPVSEPAPTQETPQPSPASEAPAPQPAIDLTPPQVSARPVPKRPAPQRKPQPKAQRPQRPAKPPKPPKTPKEPKEKKGSPILTILLILLGLAVVAAAVDILWLGRISPKYLSFAPVFKGSPFGSNEPPVTLVDEPADSLDSASSELQEEFTQRAETDTELAASTTSTTAKGTAASPATTPTASTPPAPKATPAPQPSAYPAASARADAGSYGSPSASNVYHVVVGSFRESANADRMRDELRGQGYSESACIERDNGMTSVTVGSYPTQREAFAAQQRLQEAFPNAWVLRH